MGLVSLNFIFLISAYKVHNAEAALLRRCGRHDVCLSFAGRVGCGQNRVRLMMEGQVLSEVGKMGGMGWSRLG